MSEKKNEVVDYYNHIADLYDADRFMNSYGRFIDKAERKIMDQLLKGSRKEVMKSLEIACGTGRLTNYATHGLDASDAMMTFARKKHPNVDFRLASATTTGYDPEIFDMVYSFHLLMHLDDDTIQEVFDEVYRILKHDGIFIFDIPSKKRRKILHHKQSNWHGGTELSSEDIARKCGDKFVVRKRFGLLMLPIHALPSFIRKYLYSLDYMLANSWLKEYSSYLVYELVKK